MLGWRLAAAFSPGSTMSSLDGSSGSANPAPAPKERLPFLVLAAGLLFFAAAVGVAFIMLRPTTLRIAVGPAGSDDLQLVQAMAQTFATDTEEFPEVKIHISPLGSAIGVHTGEQTIGISWFKEV